MSKKACIPKVASKTFAVEFGLFDVCVRASLTRRDTQRPTRPQQSGREETFMDTTAMDTPVTQPSVHCLGRAIRLKARSDWILRSGLVDSWPYAGSHPANSSQRIVGSGFVYRWNQDSSTGTRLALHHCNDLGWSLLPRQPSINFPD